MCFNNSILILNSIYKSFLVFLYLFIIISCQLNAQEVQFISNKSDPNFGGLKIFDLSGKGLIENNSIKIFPAELFENKKDDLPSMMGELFLEKNVIYFLPRFPFRPNKNYVVEIRSENIYLQTILIPEIQKTQQAFVENVYPTADVWPANQLKIYLHFSAPMGLGNIYEHIRLLDENGQEVEKPFLEIEPPLWDKPQQRLTLWFDPGRIKRHLSPNKKLGPPLEENKKYTLVVSKNAKDASGNFLASSFEKKIATALNDREKPTMSLWEISCPKTKNKNPLIIYFPESMDRGTLESGIGVVDENSQVVEGDIEINNFEKRWLFYPKNNWTTGNYKLMFSEKIEDLAGNNLKRLFDKEILNNEKVKEEQPILEISFLVK